jgi:catalase-peroxidase
MPLRLHGVSLQLPSPCRFPLFFNLRGKTTVKLLHRDMGPISRYLGPEVPKQRFIWQDPLPTVTYSPITDEDEAKLKALILAAPGVTISNLITVAWGSASTFRGGDKRGGANGARIALQPQVSWAVNNPKQLQIVLSAVRLVPPPSVLATL